MWIQSVRTHHQGAGNSRADSRGLWMFPNCVLHKSTADNNKTIKKIGLSRNQNADFW